MEGGTTIKKIYYFIDHIIDDLSPCDLSQNNVKKLKVTNLEQINSTLNRYGASMYNKYKK